MEPETAVRDTFLPFAREDLYEVLEIEKLSFDKPWSENQFERELKNPLSHGFVVRVDLNGTRTLAGYIIFWIVAGEAHILNMAVRPGFRRQGIARGLLAYTLESLERRGVYEVTLEVRESNTIAIDLYARFGFDCIYVRRKYYGDEDAVVMKLKLGRGS